MFRDEYDNFGNKLNTIVPDSSISSLGTGNLPPPPGMIGDKVNDPTAPSSLLSGGTATNLQVEGVVKVGKDANSAGVNTGIAASDIVFWAGADQDDRATAPFRVDLAGNVNMTSATISGVPITQQSIYGDGSDGAATISGDTDLTSDKFYTNLTINSGINLNTKSFRIFCSGTLTNAGTIRNNGSNGTVGTTATGQTGATGGAGGAAVASGSLPAGVVGVTGGNGGDGAPGATSPTAGANGTAVAKSVGTAGVTGGAGGACTEAGGGGGTGGAQTGTVFNKIRNAISAYMLLDTLPSVTLFGGSSGSGAGGGGDGGAASSGTAGGGGGGGGSGSPGGFIQIFAKTIINSGTIQTNGGNGANGGNGSNGVSGNSDGGAGGGGGSGGNGGVIVMVYGSLTNSGTIQAAGGSAGSGGTKGNDSGTGGGNTQEDGSVGNAGAAGVIIQLQV